jgi:hypothetical protein
MVADQERQGKCVRDARAGIVEIEGAGEQGTISVRLRKNESQ